MIDRFIAIVVEGAVLVSALASPATAQTRVEIAATIGRYAPLGSFEPASVYSVRLPMDASSLSGTAFGGQLRLWATPRLGIQIAGTTASSSVGGGLVPFGYDVAATSARVSMATAELLFQLTGVNHRARVWLGAGGAAVRHGGEAYAPFGNPVNYGGAAGVGSAIRLAGPLNVELGVTTVVYRMNMRGTAATDIGLMERGTQVDALFHTGLSYSWR